MIDLLTVVAGLLLAGLAGFGFGRRSAQKSGPWVIGQPEAVEEPSAEVQKPAATPSIAIERALADLPLGVVIVEQDGNASYRNSEAMRFATGRHSDALVEAALERVVDGALVGLSLEESVEVYGPPPRSLVVQASPSYDDGKISGAVAVIDDVTETRFVDRVRSDFVANVSHELRTPVGAMSVLAETIADAEDPEVVRRLTDRMQREANRLSNTIDDLLALSRLESGPVTDPETIDLVSVATMAIERTSEAAHQRGVIVGLDSEGHSVLIEGDQGQLVSAVSNLIDNAVKYSDAAGRVTVEVRAVAPQLAGRSTAANVSMSQPGADSADSADGADGAGGAVPGGPPAAQVAQLSVIDTGIGIPDRDLNRIFERFYRVDSARRRETGGTGLGLSIVRHAVLNHRGDIDVVSAEGKGSTFTMRFPLSAIQARIAPDRKLQN